MQQLDDGGVFGDIVVIHLGTNGPISAASLDGVLAPGDRLMAFQTQHPGLARALSKAAASGATALEFCYCSIFDECWLSGDEERAGAEHALAACPPLESQAFLE